LVAEDVARVDPDLVVRDKDGAPYTVRYEAVNAMLLNEFLKEHQQVERQSAKVQAQSVQLAAQQKELESLCGQTTARAIRQAKLAVQKKQLQSIEDKLNQIQAHVGTGTSD
jgi:septal ring factor EnvC (AmiA/AmiB activator)